MLHLIPPAPLGNASYSYSCCLRYEKSEVTQGGDLGKLAYPGLASFWTTKHVLSISIVDMFNSG